MSGIPQAWIEAGALALSAWLCPCDDDRCDCPDLSQDAEAVLTAALPLIREALAQQIEAMRLALPGVLMSYHGTARSRDDMSWALAQARDVIARGGAS